LRHPELLSECRGFSAVFTLINAVDLNATESPPARQLSISFQ
jgi:hypothetical protein